MKIKLTESALKKIIRKAVSESLMEGTTSTEVATQWDECIENLGESGMIDALYNYLNHDQIVDFLDYVNRNYDLWY